MRTHLPCEVKALARSPSLEALISKPLVRSPLQPLWPITTRRGTKEFTSHPLPLTFCPHYQFPLLELLSSRDNTHPKQPHYFLLLYWFYNPPVPFHQPKHHEELFGINRCATSSSPGMAGQGRRCGIGLSFALNLSLYVNFALNFALKPSIALVITLIMTARSNYSQKHLTHHFCPCEGSQSQTRRASLRTIHGTTSPLPFPSLP